MAIRKVQKNDGYTLFSTLVGGDQLQITAFVTDVKHDPLLICENIYTDIIDLLENEKMMLVHERLFGNIQFHAKLAQTRNKVFTSRGLDANMPFTYIEGQPCDGEGFAGLQVRGFRPADTEKDVWTLFDEKTPVGRAWKRGDSTFMMLQNVQGLVDGISLNGRMTETANMFGNTQTILAREGADFKNVVRTWIYLSNILDWYGDFNIARNKKFQELNLLQNPDIEHAERIYLPASTGIRGNNPFNSWGTMDVLAVVAGDSVVIEPTSGIQQKSPYRYGSAFSRGMNIREKDMTRIFLSGTASIDELGNSLFIGDTRAQIRKTLDVAAALVEEEGAKLQDICDATVFLKYAHDYEIYQQVAREYGLENMPAVCVVADVCRPELLFELDAEFVIEK